MRMGRSALYEVPPQQQGLMWSASQQQGCAYGEPARVLSVLRRGRREVGRRGRWQTAPAPRRLWGQPRSPIPLRMAQRYPGRLYRASARRARSPAGMVPTGLSRPPAPVAGYVRSDSRSLAGSGPVTTRFLAVGVSPISAALVV